MGNKMTIEDLYISVEDVYNQYESRKIDEVLATETLVRVCQHFVLESVQGNLLVRGFTKDFLKKMLKDLQIEINRS